MLTGRAAKYALRFLFNQEVFSNVPRHTPFIPAVPVLLPQEFHWGLGTLSHAQTAQTLWRDGLTQANLCGTATGVARTGTTVRAAGTGDSVVTEAAGTTPTNDVVTNNDSVANDSNTGATMNSTVP